MVCNLKFISRHRDSLGETAIAMATEVSAVPRLGDGILLHPDWSPMVVSEVVFNAIEDEWLIYLPRLNIETAKRLSADINELVIERAADLKRRILRGK